MKYLDDVMERVGKGYSITAYEDEDGYCNVALSHGGRHVCDLSTGYIGAESVKSVIKYQKIKISRLMHLFSDVDAIVGRDDSDEEYDMLMSWIADITDEIVLDHIDVRALRNEFSEYYREEN